ncbi:MAG TPA: helix-turn-helix domain-containing protein [Spirochaetota bacterium]|nr:helix-turn-helix domain-containing protein [Spirochaetota bacterium]HPF07039.1 helix-turn-helix domain-containing protein [Spirochaetota bacterium]HPJ42293.1 helix-turn-helix domain-containing protein [Spirochaetota bacterium]HPR36998.1 helix-turn-helix domain-containing protein [Spirochaetota bacterium]HRX47234.1 helix-turn-helix domain-containing protein [Spirochaetota bacterium]
MIITIAEKFIFFSGLSCFLTATGQLMVKKRKRENINLFVLFSLLGVILLQFYSVVTQAIIFTPELISYHSTVMFIFSPVLYYAYFVVAFPGVEPPRRFYLFFIPALLAFACDTYLVMLEQNLKIIMVNDFFNNRNSPGVLIFKLTTAGAVLQLLLYHLALIRILVPSMKGKGDDKSIIYITFIYSIGSTVATLLAIPGYLSGDVAFIRRSALFISICFIFTYLVSIRYPHFLQLLSMNVKKGGYSRSLLKGIDVDALMEGLDSVMKSERLYLNEEITLKDVAAILDITHHQLSQLLNERLNMNFNTFVNTYRVEFAKELLVEKTEWTVLNIAYEAGFNSKSTFYDAFTKIAGVTPLEFRKSRNRK